MKQRLEDEQHEEFLQRLRRMHQDLGIPRDWVEQSRLPLQREPPVLVDTEPDHYQRPQKLTPAALKAWREMKQAAAGAQVEFFLISAFRSAEYQQGLFAKKLAAGQKIEEILRVNAAPGFSEHHSGRAIDIGSPECRALEEEFEDTAAYRWLCANAAGYGFFLSYPRDNPSGIRYEPWHWCYRDS
ncbi:MAG: M15 family metallopeptidase [Pseudohongiellaceae bacterium]